MDHKASADVEFFLPAGEFIYSRTDTKGIIEDMNNVFADVCGYSTEEMIGKPHNLIRHPDMPSEAFADMWRDLKDGRPWRGIVKNRRKDGGFYWVLANVFPIRLEDKIVGYQSVRTIPDRGLVAKAEADYQQIKAKKSGLSVQHGYVVKKRNRLFNLLFSETFRQVAISLISLLAIAFFCDQCFC